MITPSEITTHIKTYLPIQTNRFTELLTVTSASIDASNILTINATAHGKTVGSKIVITGGTVRNPLTASVSVDDAVQFTTVYDHDQIRPSLPGDTQNLNLNGFTGGDTGWNDEHPIIDVPNRRNFIVDGNPAPTVNESQYLVENLLTGVYVVATVPSVNSFTVSFSGSPALPVGTVDGLTAISGFRISAVADFKRAQAVYSKQDSAEAYLFVIMLDGEVSKDRHTLNEGVGGFTNQTMNLMRVFRNFATAVFLPTGADLSGADAQDLAYGDIYVSLLATLFGFADTTQVIKYTAVPTGDGPGEYNTAYYAHVFDWQMPETITFEDGWLDTGDVAFRDIEQTFRMFNYPDTDAVMTTDINLDDDPL